MALGKSGDKVYDLKVTLVGGRVTEEFVAKNPVVSRTIRIAGKQTLEDLHDAIFEAYDRHDEHMYEFQFGGRKPNDRNARSYVLPMAMQSLFGEEDPAGLVTKTKIGSLDLKPKEVFFYWFDFGDDWWHKIQVLAIHENMPGKYPLVIDKVGENPPQYPGLDEEEDYDEDEEEG